MAKTVKTRIQHKRETAANWASATSFKPMEGELIVYKPDNTGDPAMLKVGDGSTVAKDLPFIKAGSATTADSATKDGAGNTITSTYAKNADLTAHTGNTTVHITAAERTKWNNASNHAGYAHAPSDAEKNVQSDWAVTDTSSDAFIKNKPTIPTAASDVGAVPTTRKVNNKVLSADISLTASDVGAATTTDITNAINNLDVNAPTADGNTTSFIDSVSQTNGKISATKKTITSASTSAAGIVKLNDAVNSTSTTTAATANAVKKAYDAATSAAADAASRAPATHSHDYIQGGTVGIKASDSNEVSFASNANYIYFGYDNRMNSSSIVDTYKFGKHSGAAAAADGNIECGSLVARRTLKGGTVTVANAATLQYDSTNECLNFVFV